MSGWKSSWRRGSPQLAARLAAHARSVREITGGKVASVGWKAELDSCVVEWLEAETRERRVRPYDGRDVLDLLRAIRNGFEHWFERKRSAEEEARRQAVVHAMTGWDGGQISDAHSSRDSRQLRAEAVARYFLSERFPSLLLIFEFGSSVL